MNACKKSLDTLRQLQKNRDPIIEGFTSPTKEQ